MQVSSLELLDNYESKAQHMLEQFVDPLKEVDPQIAVSVDMMDTGVDAPRVVNLVFFKLVKSYSKFWQMIGRGTRLCEDLFEPGKDKEHFVIFDYCENFEYFNENPDGISGNTIMSLTQRIFDLKVDIIVATKNKNSSTGEEAALEKHCTEQLYNAVKGLDKERFMVKMSLRYVNRFCHESSWNNLAQVDVLELKEHVSKLMLPEKDDHELARRFDILILNLQLAMLVAKDGSNFVTKIASIAQQLSKVNVPDVKANMALLQELQTEPFWKHVNVKRLNEVRVAIRELMKYLESRPQEAIYTNWQDDIDLTMVEEVSLIEYSTKLQSYKDRVESYIRKNKHHVTIQKLRGNTPITADELQELEKMLFEGDAVGTRKEYEQEYGEQPLGKFIRSIVGLDIKAANEAFSGFIQDGTLRADQMTFIKNIISFLEKNGTIDKALLFEAPFTDMHDQGLMGLFDDADARKVISIVDSINENAGVA